MPERGKARMAFTCADHLNLLFPDYSLEIRAIKCAGIHLQQSPVCSDSKDTKLSAFSILMKQEAVDKMSFRLGVKLAICPKIFILDIFAQPHLCFVVFLKAVHTDVQRQNVRLSSAGC